MSDEDIERFEDDMELRLWREYRDVLPMFAYVVETERRFYLANQVELRARRAGRAVVRGRARATRGCGTCIGRPGSSATSGW